MANFKIYMYHNFKKLITYSKKTLNFILYIGEWYGIWLISQ